MLLSLLLSVAAAAPLSLSYPEALDKALASNAALQRAGFAVEAAEGALLAAKGTFDPQLYANLGYVSAADERTEQYGEVLSHTGERSAGLGLSQRFATGTSLQIGASSIKENFRYELRDTGQIIESAEPQYTTRLAANLSQSLLQGLKTAYNLSAVRAATRAQSQAALEARQLRDLTLANVATHYWTLWYQVRAAEIAHQGIAVAEEELRVVTARVEQGTLAPVERTRASALLVAARTIALEAEAARRLAQDQLLLDLGLPPGQEVAPTTTPADPVPVKLDAEALVKAALANNPELAALREAAAQADEVRDFANHARLPDLTATAGYALLGYEPSLGQSTSELLSNDLHEWSLGAALIVPLGNRADKGAAAAADARSRQAATLVAERERAIASALGSQINALDNAILRLELAQANARLAEETLAAEKALQAAGRAIQKDVLLAIQTRGDAEVAVEKARIDYQIAFIELERLKGSI